MSDARLKLAVRGAVAASLLPVARRIIRKGLTGCRQLELIRLEIWNGWWRRRRRRHFEANTGPCKPVILFLAPEAGLTPFFASHVILARVLSDAGHSVVILSCDGLQRICSAKAAMQVKPTASGETRNAACQKCRITSLKVGKDYGLPDISLESLLDDSCRFEIDAIMTSNAAKPWETIYDGIEIGAGCLGETLRAQRKTSTAELNAEDLALLTALLHSSLAIYLAVKAVAARFKIARIAYFGDYAYFLPPQVFAARNNIPVTNVCHAYHRDTDRRFLNLWPTHGIAHQLSQVDRWPSYRHMPVDPTTVASIADGALFRLYGHGGVSTYSPNWVANAGDLLAQLGLPPSGKTLVVYTNSTDELVCNRNALRVLGYRYGDAPNPFSSQMEWLAELIDWASKRDGVRLILRLHPRMAISSRHTNLASEYAEMKKAFASLPANVAVVWPESPISSYNLAELADVALTAWSSISLELARFGVPVVAAFQKIGPFPKSSFIDFAETPRGYFEAIESALVRKPSFDTIVEAFRWTYFLHWTPLIDISDVVPEPGYEGVPRYRTPRSRDTILKVVAEGLDVVALNVGRLSQEGGAYDAERRAVAKAIQEFISYFKTGRVNDATGFTNDNAVSSMEAPNVSATRTGQTAVAFQERERTTSPLVGRLEAALGDRGV